MLLKFLLEQQKKLVENQKQTLPLENIMSQCEPYLSNQNNNKFLHLLTESNTILHHVLDEEYFNLWKVKSKDGEINVQNEKIFALFTSPLNENWKEIMATKGDYQFAIRTGFFQDEYEIYHSILMGFQGLSIYVLGLDVYQVQYLTEIAREYSFSLFFIVHNKDELNIVLQTDAPYIVFSSYEAKNFDLNVSFLYKLSQFVPKSANLFAIGNEELVKNKSKLLNLRYSGFFIS